MSQNPRKQTKAKVKPLHDDPEQSSAFIEKAREIGADEEHSEADSLIGHLAKKPPESRVNRKKR
jgi:hypothetical protein